MIRFSINVYPARGHATGSGGNGETQGTNGGMRVHYETDDREVVSDARSRFVDQVLAKIRLRNAIAEERETTADLRQAA